ncbi:MAG: ATP--guanido phosphotransferase, partial [Candidatus Omnitrophica bacterium]|nr:ATP--guanido phosphotransferase [Candidatus Omnitrophota bacterium]
MKIDGLLNHSSEWLKASGPNSDIVISSRIRLARNLEMISFPHWADKKQSEQVLNAVTASALKIDYLKGSTVLKMADLDVLDKQLLVERHLMSYEQAQKADHKAVIIDDNEIISLMVNEEDHIRMQVMQSGLNLFEAWNIINKIDDYLARELPFAFLP